MFEDSLSEWPDDDDKARLKAELMSQGCKQLRDVYTAQPEEEEKKDEEESKEPRADQVKPKPKKKKKGKPLRVSTAECAVEKPLLKEVIQANRYVEVEIVTASADFTFLHPM